MSKLGISLKVDFVFRRVFGSESNKDLLIALLNAITRPDIPIVEVRILNPFNLATYVGGKETILDIKAVDAAGVLYDVELQVYPHMMYGRRAVYYVAKDYVDQMDAGDGYTNLNVSIGIHILGFRYFEDDRICRQFVFKDADTNEVSDEIGCLRLYFVELPKFDKDWTQAGTALEKWVLLFNKATEIDADHLPEQLSDDPAIVRAVAEIERIGLDPAERAIYQAQEKAFMASVYEIMAAEQKGIQQGKQEGRQEGRQEGMMSMVLRILANRLGDVPPATNSRLNRLSADELMEFSSAATSLGSYAEVDAWLARN